LMDWPLDGMRRLVSRISIKLFATHSECKRRPANEEG